MATNHDGDSSFAPSAGTRRPRRQSARGPHPGVDLEPLAITGAHHHARVEVDAVALRGVNTFQAYCAPRPMQLGAVRALREGAGGLSESGALYAAAARESAETLCLGPTSP